MGRVLYHCTGAGIAHARRKPLLHGRVINTSMERDLKMLSKLLKASHSVENARLKINGGMEPIQYRIICCQTKSYLFKKSDRVFVQIFLY